MFIMIVIFDEFLINFLETKNIVKLYTFNKISFIIVVVYKI